MLLSTGHAVAPVGADVDRAPSEAPATAGGPAKPAPDRVAGFVPQVRIELPPPVAADPPPVVEIAAAVDAAETVAPAAVPAPPEQTPAWKADIPQLTESEVQATYVPQLNEPGLVAGAGPTLVAKIDAMQVGITLPMIKEDERAALVALGPTEMTVRIGDEAIGKVAFRSSETGIDVQLSGLLDLVADRFPAEDFSRLRNSEAANSYVSADDLRAAGLTLDYDPVYDELRLSA